MLEQEVLAVAQAAKNASPALAQATAQERNAALTAMARALRDRSGAIVAANAQDMTQRVKPAPRKAASIA